MIIWTWRVSLLLELLCCVLVFRRSSPATLAFFSADLARSTVLAFLPGSYAALWTQTEPLALALLWLVAWDLCGRRGWQELLLPGSGWCLIFAAASTSRESMLWMHCVLVLSIAAVAIVLVAWRHSAHLGLIAVYFAVESVSYLAVLLGSGNDPRPAQIMVVGQSLCFLGWLAIRQ